MADAISETASNVTATPAALKLGNSDSYSHSFQIMTICLNGSNFMHWSQAVRIYIYTHIYQKMRKIGYLTVETKESAKTDVIYSTWDAENSMIMAWLVNAME